MTMAWVIAIVGWAGAIMILASYLLLTAGRLAATSTAYQLLNLLGAAAFVVNSGWNGAMPSASVNVIWAGIAIVALVRDSRRRTAALARPPAD